MRLICSLIVVTFLLTSNLSAVTPQFWKLTTPEDFLAGEIEGFAVSSRGELRPGPSLEKIATFTDPFVLSQASDLASGARFFGTGNGGKIYRLKGEKLDLLYTAAEPEIYALAFWNGALYAGSSPNGKIYRVDPVSGSATEWFDPKQAYIWALVPLSDGTLAAGTGVEGKLFKIDAKGSGKVLFDSNNTHIRSLSPWRNNSLLAGGAGKGTIYEIDSIGKTHALFDASFSEISAIWFDATSGMAWAAGVTNVLPSAATPKGSGTAKPAAGEAAAGEKKKDEGPPSPVEVSFSFDEPSTSTPSGSSELYRIDRDGYVETVRKFEREMVYALAGGEKGSVFLSTGPLGRIYEFRDDEISLIATVPEKQVVSFLREGRTSLVTTTNSGAVYKLSGPSGVAAEYRSAIKDMERFSKLGRYRAEAVNGATLRLSFRSGNTSTPDSTWSGWSDPVTGVEGEATAPAARYVQWKGSLDRGAPELAVDSVTISYLNRNVRPVIDSLTVGDPGVVYIGSGYPGAGQLVEATNPDENGIFTSLDVPRERSDPGKRAFRKGYRTVSWKGRDDNGDSLRYWLSFRRKGLSDWLRLRDNIEETQLNFDTSQLPDGIYELRLVITDKEDNPEQPLTGSKDGVEMLVDNGAPSIEAVVTGGGTEIRVSDRLSPVIKVEYSIDAQKWIRLMPVDGIADAQSETFRLPATLTGNRFVVVRAVDAFYNVATESVRVP